jgi:hypothetical protein
MTEEIGFYVIASDQRERGNPEYCQKRQNEIIDIF